MKPLDERQVEYAYLNRFDVVPNIPTGDTFKTRLSLHYELKDAGKNDLAIRSIDHYLPHGDKLTVDEINALVADNLDTLVSADKLQLSGYTP